MSGGESETLLGKEVSDKQCFDLLKSNIDINAMVTAAETGGKKLFQFNKRGN